MTENTYEFTKTFKQPSDKVWRFLTDSEKLSRWFLPNDFKLEGREQFHLWTTPTSSWDGVLNGRVSDYAENEYLSYELSTSVSPETSRVLWSIKEGQNVSHLSLRHEGAPQLVDTIYRAINGTQVSGHYATPVSTLPVGYSNIVIQPTKDKVFLEDLRDDLLSDPMNLEHRVAVNVAKYPEFVEHIVCLAVEAFPERAKQILKAANAKGAGHAQKLLGLTLFLLLFKDAVSEAEAAEENSDAEALKDDILSLSEELEEDASTLTEEEKEAVAYLKELKQDSVASNFRVAASIAIALVVVLNAEDVFAAVSERLIESTDTLSVNASDIVEAGQGNNDAGDDVPALSGLFSSHTLRNIEVLQSDAIVETSKTHVISIKQNLLNADPQQVREAVIRKLTSLRKESEEEASLLTGETAESDLVLDESFEDYIQDEELLLLDDFISEWENLIEFEESNQYNEEDYGDYGPIDEGPYADVVHDDEGVDENYYEPIDHEEEGVEVHDPRIEAMEQKLQAFIDYVEEKYREELLAIVMYEDGPALVFDRADLEYLFENPDDESIMGVIVLESDEAIERFDESGLEMEDSYRATGYMEDPGCIPDPV